MTSAVLLPDTTVRGKNKTAALHAWIGRPAIILGFLVLFYCALFHKYHAYEVDNSWYASFSYNLVRLHVGTDLLWHERFPGGADGTHLFGRLAGYTQGIYADALGWRPVDLFSLSLLFTIGSLGLWWSSMRRLGMGRAFVGYFVLLLGVSEPVLSVAEKFRYEFFSFFLFAVAVWFVSRAWYFPALLVGFLAVETQPAALSVALAVLVLAAWRSERKLRLVLQALVAGCLAALAYVLLHPHGVQAVLAKGAMKGSYVPGGTIRAYFGNPRHGLESLTFLVGGWLFWKRRARMAHPEIGLAALTVVLFFLLMPHPNVHYVAFAEPLLLLLTLMALEHDRKLFWLPIAMTLCTLLQYAYFFKINLHEGYSSANLAQVDESIHQAEQQLGLQDSNARIVGDFSLWFAHPHNFLASGALTADVQRGDLYLCYDGLLQPRRLSTAGEVTCADLERKISLAPVSQVNLRGHTLRLLRRVPSSNGG